ncbi:MAG: hypothetical protein RBR20_05645 [Desulfobacterales bacterium]|jgi:hypothetical protein|nr:hypothetical protein [Desulfobacteraceae bacterium]MDD3991298.1 hypothetical protein [Desulfobacteraceae bacterium]MDY0311589.1 hypothetical protein [Desulfobacterales bacterium]
MDRITLEELKETFLEARFPWCVSIYMPTHRAGREAEQDPIRFKNLLRETENRFLTQGLRSPEARERIKEAHQLLQDGGFWKRRSNGLAVFLSDEGLRAFRLPVPFEETLVVSDRYHVKPLLPLLTRNNRFFILALSQNQIRLLEATDHTAFEVELEGLPLSLAESVPDIASDRSLQFHTGTPPGAGQRAAMFFGHDISKENKDKLLRWFRMIDRKIREVMGDAKAPLVLAGVDALFPLYREASTYAPLLDEGLPGNPESLKPEDLHSQAWPLVAPVFEKSQEEAGARYRQLFGTGQTTNEVKEAVLAAHHGRVETLFVAVGVQVWGRYDPRHQHCDIHPLPTPGDEDLLDLTAIQTLLRGGIVYAVPPDQVPDQQPLAAVFRF